MSWAGACHAAPSVECMLMRSGTDMARHRTGDRRRIKPAILIAVCMVVALVVPTVSYLGALTYPGQASLGVRTVEWIRDHGGSPIVDAIENWWYTRSAPTGAAPDPSLLPTAVPATPDSASAARAVGLPANLPALAGIPALPGEGVWTAGRPAPDGVPAMYSTFIRPDAEHPSVIAGVARFDQRRTRARLIAGTREPDGQTWPEGGQVPPDMRAGLVAAFNSGFKMVGARGGFYADGRFARPLRDGAASLVINRDGRMSVGEWGRDAHFGPDIAAVRQNLALIIDGGTAVAGLGTNAGGRWGSPRNQLQYTWRSAIGTDRTGSLIYVGGNQLTLASLARALTAAGAQEAMELDIHPRMVDLLSYRQSADTTPVGTPLLPAMPGPAARYLSPDQRDFIAVALR